MDEEVKEALEWEKMIISMIQRGHYTSAYILLGERLRQQVRNK